VGVVRLCAATGAIFVSDERLVLLPKKSTRRATRTKSAPRRPQPRSPGAGAAVAERTEPVVPTAPAATARPTAPPPATRRATTRREPTTTVNYAYLRRDVRVLAVLAPAMVVLVIIAFLVFH
jgi:hypothetical protein